MLCDARPGLAGCANRNRNRESKTDCETHARQSITVTRGEMAGDSCTGFRDSR